MVGDPPWIDGPNLPSFEDELAVRDAEITRLRDLVRSAYSEGFTEGTREHSSFNGGKTWAESKSRAALSLLDEARK